MWRIGTGKRVALPAFFGLMGLAAATVQPNAGHKEPYTLVFLPTNEVESIKVVVQDVKIENVEMVCNASSDGEGGSTVLGTAYDRNYRLEQRFVDIFVGGSPGAVLPASSRYYEASKLSVRDVMKYGTGSWVNGRSELVGREVLFFRNSGGEDGWDLRFASPIDARKELLEGLTPHSDLQFLLPPQPVAIGEAWDVTSSELNQLLFFGGCHPFLVDLKELSAAVKGDRNMVTALDKAIFEGVAGEVSCKLISYQESEGRALVAVEGSLESNEKASVWRWPSDFQASADVPPDYAKLNLRVKVEGWYVWDINNHCLSRAEFLGGIDVRENLEGGILFRDLELYCSAITARWEGEWSLSVKASVD